METTTKSIIELLGGKEFLEKSKAYNVLESPAGVSFSIPKEPYANEINSIQIYATPFEDSYSLEMGTQKHWGYFQKAQYPSLTITELKERYEAITKLDMWS